MSILVTGGTGYIGSHTVVELLNQNKEDERLLKALIHSNKVMIEDILREAGYMLPQSKNTNKLLNDIKQNGDKKTKEIASRLLDKIEVNE